ncbi:GTP cyclohydrolase FolE2 [Salinicola rhizosphaerae]|uniref:GTP cyclohydrolase FolE2 n=2 Tax=Salinicola rhizosphaerae TaxID=1443141 RepID=A0ABQ3DXD9_9GAMM|nr:GTP cyclohydrolase FolE2 [Salinicola rhizosphaerae]
MTSLRPLPDVAGQTGMAGSQQPRALQHVGMGGIAARLLLEDGTRLPITVDVGVDLAARHRGIHMSRLYRLLDRLDDTPLGVETFHELGASLLDSQQGISERLELALHFDLPLRRPALLSEASGWRHYPVTLTLSGTLDALRTVLTISLDYSSTCPCSAALARHAMARDWRAWAEEHPDAARDPETLARWIEQDGSFPTPHSQRSRARIALVLEDSASLDFASRIGDFEDTLQTPVQTLVKRIDEQAFAERNGANLMFCEDAARRLGDCCDAQSGVSGYRIGITHAESLHAHDAVARIERNFEAR